MAFLPNSTQKLNGESKKKKRSDGDAKGDLGFHVFSKVGSGYHQRWMDRRGSLSNQGSHIHGKTISFGFSMYGNGISSVFFGEDMEDRVCGGTKFGFNHL